MCSVKKGKRRRIYFDIERESRRSIGTCKKGDLRVLEPELEMDYCHAGEREMWTSLATREGCRLKGPAA